MAVENDTLLDIDYSSCMDKENHSQEWLLMGSPLPVTAVIALYLAVVLKWGPDYMKDKEPYRLKNVMRIYNIVQVLYNSAILYIFLTPVKEVLLPMLYLLINSCTDPREFAFLTPVKEVLFPILYLVMNSCTSPREFAENNEFFVRNLYLTTSWYFLGLKILDLLDTIFMILRKKSSHVTFLHVYHHNSTVFLLWYTFKYIKPIQGAFPVFLNLIVHAVMYSYYFLATFDSFKKYLWWKKHLTKLQMTQLVLVISYLSFLYYNQCPMSRPFTYIWLTNVFANLFLFLNFYIRAYIFNQNTNKNVNKTQ